QAKDRAVGKIKSRLLQVRWRGGHGDKRCTDQRHHGTGLAERDGSVAPKDFDPLGVKARHQHLEWRRGGVGHCYLPRHYLLLRGVEREDLRGHEITALGLQTNHDPLDKPGTTRLDWPSLSRYQALALCFADGWGSELGRE